jgi:hypothetical protein
MQRLTQDGRTKGLAAVGGDPRFAYFGVMEGAAKGLLGSLFSIELDTRQQRGLFQGLPMVQGTLISPDGKQIAYSVPQGGSFDIHVGETGAPPDAARKVCSACGSVTRFSQDSRYLLIVPEDKPGTHSELKSSMALLELATGKITASWLADPVETVSATTFAGDWLLITARAPRNDSVSRIYAAKFDTSPIPRSQWAEVKLLPGYSFSLTDPFIYAWQGEKVMGSRFDPKQRRFGELFEVRIPPGGGLTLTSKDRFYIRGSHLVFQHNEDTGSIWLAKLPK